MKQSPCCKAMLRYNEMIAFCTKCDEPVDFDMDTFLEGKMVPAPKCEKCGKLKLSTTCSNCIK